MVQLILRLETVVESVIEELKVDNEGNEEGKEKTEKEEPQLTKFLAMVLTYTEFIYQKRRQER